MNLLITHTIPVIREIEARSIMKLIQEDGEKVLVETENGERYYIFRDYTKEVKEVKSEV